MRTLLIVDSSARTNRSITRDLSARCAEVWRARVRDGSVIHHDVGRRPPPAIDGAWIAAAYADGESRGTSGAEALRTSDAWLDDLEAADAIVFGAPLYNFGMPAQLKAWFDQIVRIGRSFAFDVQTPGAYRPLLRRRPVLAVSAAGSREFHPGGACAALNFLEPHLATLCEFVGLGAPTFVRVGGAEEGDPSLGLAIAAAQAEVERLVESWTAPSPGALVASR